MKSESEGTMLQFVKTSDPHQAAEALTTRLQEALAKRQRVLWLVSGGSNIPLSVQVMRALPPDTHQNLAIMLTDERFGSFNHTDSNMHQLAELGFEPGMTTVVPVLVPGKQTLDETCVRYNRAIRTAFRNADVIIAQLGMGADGHIGGILPDSLAADPSKKFVVGYDAGTFLRITLTPHALKQVTTAYLFAFGDTKRQALINLEQKALSLRQQPAQILHQVPEAYVYNDQVGETL
jgi:6-phosphogluconolactonase/glucosamine-6-phosphate isomerase/deaminase